ncbi:6030_t:CDS:2 [Ambispora gerdemannii]|uniref:6030_t:CDS:1 n=1 Tax=Ambispora gerdemannii TaxID=144530 RepID=A0A9N8V784_9GLOM|nr:6030_t:CDS:2 [Ambispora gerdemannii]
MKLAYRGRSYYTNDSILETSLSIDDNDDYDNNELNEQWTLIDSPNNTKFPKYSTPVAQELLAIFNEGNNRWEYDEVILVDVKLWLDKSNYLPEVVFRTVYNLRHNLDYFCLLAFLYLYGVGTSPNPTAAFGWYKKAAEAGDVLGQNETAMCHQMGAGTKQDHVMAFLWYLKSATGGFPVAQYKLAWSYFNGRGTDADLNMALYWFEKSARTGFHDAQDHLGYCYQVGKL